MFDGRTNGVRMKIIIVLFGVIVTMVAAWSGIMGSTVIQNGKDIVQLQGSDRAWELVRKDLAQVLIRLNAISDIAIESNAKLLLHLENCHRWQTRHENRHHPEG